MNEYIFLFMKSWRLSFFLLISVTLGGTSQDIVEYKLPIYLMSIFLIAWAINDVNEKRIRNHNNLPFILGGTLIFLFLVYLIPLPPEVWVNIAGRNVITNTYDLVGIRPTWMPLSLVPEKTLFSLLDFLPILAVFSLVIISAKKTELRRSYTTIIVITTISAGLGIIQATFGNEVFYMYSVTNLGDSVGFFSNANHHACFLAMTAPLCLYYFFERIKDGKHAIHYKLASVVCGFLIALSLILSQSVAGYILFSLGVFLTTRTLIFHKQNQMPSLIAGICLSAVSLLLITIVFSDGFD